MAPKWLWFPCTLAYGNSRIRDSVPIPKWPFAGWLLELYRLRELTTKRYIKITVLTLVIDFQSDDEIGCNVAEEYEAAALRNGRSLLPIYLECDSQENIRRLKSVQQRDTGTTKLLDSEILAELRSRCRLFRFTGVEGITADDITNMGPEESAEAIPKEVISRIGQQEASSHPT
ncbi:uncharacterized protein RCO7_14598 [Rhynchosporium graminicola]|uniref:Uncharacterized protein n=1 Tax=Rhynchosporium graminicola TaxID=2792576 RepID=A0A1E1KQP3_9HELO|nr:uncharacterized protein RCO7_14598 [Rhynchosporium commune]